MRPLVVLQFGIFYDSFRPSGRGVVGVVGGRVALLNGQSCLLIVF
jgi:hypothetical protein